jgi:hypothetical protein
MSAQEAFNFQGAGQAEISQGYPLMSVDERGVLTLPGADVLLRHMVAQTSARQAEAAGAVADVIHLNTARKNVERIVETATPTEKTAAIVEANAALSPAAAPLAHQGNEVAEAFVSMEHPLFRPKVPTAAAAAKQAKGRTGSVRESTLADIERMVDKDMYDFRDVYATYSQSQEELRADLIKKFTGRFNKVGGDWIPVHEGPGPFGFMVCCPTSKTPAQFKSWEQTTDNGTLENTYDPNGDNIYIVSLTMEGCGQEARNRVFLNQIGKMVQGGYKLAFCESRLPGLRGWMQDQCTEHNLDFDGLSKEQQFAFAERYFRATKTNSKGQEVPLDPMIRLYSRVGWTFDRVVPDAYVDEPSMNFGVVGVFKNPMPKLLRDNRLAKKVVGGGLRWLSRAAVFSKIAEKMF